MRRFFTFLLALMVGTDTLLADTGVLNYTFDVEAGEATVVKPTSGVYTGEIVVPTSAQNPSNSIYYPVRHIAESAFAGSSVTKVYLPEGLYTIGAKAFYNCDNLTSLSIPSTVTEVACTAFDGSKLLTEFIFYPVTPPTITGTYSAPQLQKKAEIYIPDNAYDASSYSNAWGGGNFTFQPLAKNKVLVGELYYHFNLCSKQAEVRSGEYTFSSVTVPSAVVYDTHGYPVTSIGNSAFSYLSKLTSVTLSEGIKEIGAGAFMNSALKTLVLPASMTSIGEYAFAYITSGKMDITSYAETPPVCGEQCFYGLNTSESKLYVPIQAYTAYRNTAPWSAFTTIIPLDVTQGPFTFKINMEAKTASLIAYDKTSTQTSATIPNQLVLGGVTYKVTSIVENVFANCTSLVSVVIPDNVSSIGFNAFANCTALSQVTLPATVPTIGGSCFYGCTSLPVTNGIRYADYLLLGPTDKTKNAYSIKSNTRVIDDNAFWNCSKLISISLPNKVEKIGTHVFDGCTSLVSAELNNGLTEIPNHTFYRCAALQSVAIPATVRKIGSQAFEKCEALQQVQLPEGLEEIGSRAFHRCAALKKCTIPASVQKMTRGEYLLMPGDDDHNSFVSTFSKCDALDTLVILSKTIGEADFLSEYFGWYIPNYVLGDNIEHLGYRAFRSAVELQSIRFPSNLKTVGTAAFINLLTMKEIALPSSVTTIADSAFYGTFVQHIQFGNSVEAIGNVAFYYAPLQELRLPATVKTIGKQAFDYCTELQSITCDALTPPALSDRCFPYNEIKNIPVTVPKNSLADYQTATGWKEFTNYQVTKSELRYEFNDNNLTASVIRYEEELPYYGDIVIPSTVEHEGKTYTVTTISYYAFSDCPDLTSITIPPTVQGVYDEAFRSCTNLQAVNISDIGAWCTTYFSFNGYNKSEAQPLTYCHRLLLNGEVISDLVLPDNTTRINAFVFAEDTALLSVTLPADMSVIQISAFRGCKNIQSITCYARDVPFANMYAFEGIDSSIPVYVPAESVEDYKAADQWSEFTNILPLPQEYELVDLSTESLTAGKYLIVFDDNKAHAAVSGKDLIASSDELTIIGGVAYVPEEAVCAVTIAPLGTDSFSILLADGTGYLDLQTKNSVTTAAKPAGFAISDAGEGDQTVKIAKYLPSESKTYVLKHNGNYFRMYSGTTYTLPSLYRKKTNVPQGIEDISSSLQGGDRGRLILLDGQIFILRGDKVYTVTGQAVK